MQRMNFSLWKNSISQTVPSEWHNISTSGSKDIRQAWKDGEVDVVVNADQTFVNFYAES